MLESSAKCLSLSLGVWAQVLAQRHHTLYGLLVLHMHMLIKQVGLSRFRSTMCLTTNVFNQVGQGAALIVLELLSWHLLLALLPLLLLGLEG